MTHYYYIASDKKLGLGNGTLDFVPTDYSIPGFDYPVQLEVLSLEKDWELMALLQYIRNHTAPHKECTIQIAHLLNSNRVELKVYEKSKILLRNIAACRQSP